jgi:hypothetical protein
MSNSHPLADKPESDWRRPYSESPVEIPDGWYGGGVHDSGGYVWLRQWQTTPSLSTYDGESVLVVAYNLQDRNVSLVEHAWDDEYDFYIHDELVDSREADVIHDWALAALARQLMEEYS